MILKFVMKWALQGKTVPAIEGMLSLSLYDRTLHLLTNNLPMHTHMQRTELSSPKLMLMERVNLWGRNMA